MDITEFVGMTTDELTTLRANILTAINTVLTSNQSYSIAGRSYNRANLAELRGMLQSVNYAITAASASPLTRVVYADMSQ